MLAIIHHFSLSKMLINQLTNYSTKGKDLYVNTKDFQWKKVNHNFQLLPNPGQYVCRKYLGKCGAFFGWHNGGYNQQLMPGGQGCQTSSTARESLHQEEASHPKDSQGLFEKHCCRPATTKGPSSPFFLQCLPRWRLST